MTETTNIPQLRFPPHSDRRVWLISSGDNPIGLNVARQALAHGDCVVSGVVPSNIVRDENRRTYFDDFLAEVERNEEHGWKDRFRTFLLDIRYDILYPCCFCSHLLTHVQKNGRMSSSRRRSRKSLPQTRHRPLLHQPSSRRLRRRTSCFIAYTESCPRPV